MTVFLIVIAAIIIFSIYMAISLSKSQKKARQEMEDKRSRHNASASASLAAVSGLPVAEGTPCDLFVTDSQLIIEAQSQEFRLEINKMIAAQKKTDVEISKEVTSSGGKAIAGAILFGPVGAIIGSRTKTKEKRTLSFFLIINYENQQGAVDVLAFEGPGSDSVVQALTRKIELVRAGTVTNL